MRWEGGDSEIHRVLNSEGHGYEKVRRYYYCVMFLTVYQVLCAMIVMIIG